MRHDLTMMEARLLEVFRALDTNRQEQLLRVGESSLQAARTPTEERRQQVDAALKRWAEKGLIKPSEVEEERQYLMRKYE